MRVAVIYATVEGQTRRIAERVAERLRSAGHEPSLAEANDDAACAAALADAEAAILAAPVHLGSYPSPFVHLVSSARARLDAVPTAFVSVTLAIFGEPEEQAEAERYPDRLAERTGWRARAVHHAAGALRYSKYDFFKRWIMRRIAAQHGYGTEHADREFTDWAALDAFLDGFLAAGAGGRAA